MKSTSPRSYSLGTTGRQPACPNPLPRTPGQASPRDNVVFEAGLFGGVLGMNRIFILHATGAKLPSDLLGFIVIRYGEATNSEIRVVNEKLRKAIENEGRVARIEGLWWQFSLTERTAKEPSALSLLKISRDRNGALELTGRSWREDGSLSARYWCEAVKERKEPSGVFYYWKGERPRDPNAPQLDGTGRNPAGVRRSRGRVLHDSLGYRSECECADSWCLLARRSRGHGYPGRKRRSATRGVDRRAAAALEVDRERLRIIRL